MTRRAPRSPPMARGWRRRSPRVVNLLDPDVIVLGGGLSSLPGLYRLVPELWAASIVAPEPRTKLVRARFGAESGLRGAAWLPAQP